MKREWKSFRISLLLYFAVLTLPLGALIGYRVYDDVGKTVTVLKQLMEVPEGLLLREKNGLTDKEKRKIARINADVETIGNWVREHRNDPDFVGGGTLQESFDRFSTCWKKGSGISSAECMNAIDSLVFSVDRMYLLKEARFKNILAVVVLGTIFILLLVIYSVRTYIAYQMKRTAVHDFATTLYNHQFLDEVFRRMCAEMKRYGRHFTVLQLQIPALLPESGKFSEEKRMQMLQSVGSGIWDLIRDSDIACHTEENSFVLLLPETTAEQSGVVKNRLEKSLARKLGKEVDMHFKTCEVTDERGCETARKECVFS